MFYRWRIKYGALTEDEAQWLKGARAGERPPEEDRGQAGAGHLEAGGSAAGNWRAHEAVRHLVRRRRATGLEPATSGV